MGIRQIRVNDDPILRKVSRPVESFDAKLFKLLDDMRDTLYDADGCGLAAVQVGMLKNLLLQERWPWRRLLLLLVNLQEVLI